MEVNIDFSGSVTFMKGFSPVYVDKNKDFMLQMVDKGAANFDMNFWSYFSMADIRKKSLQSMDLCGILVNGLSLNGSKGICFFRSKDNMPTM